MAFFGIKVFYPKAANYLNNLLGQLLEEHKKNRKFGKTKTNCLSFEIKHYLDIATQYWSMYILPSLGPFM